MFQVLFVKFHRKCYVRRRWNQKIRNTKHNTFIIICRFFLYYCT